MRGWVIGWLAVLITLTLALYLGDGKTLGGSVAAAALAATGAVIGGRIVESRRSRRG
jgi:hypothetical protein